MTRTSGEHPVTTHSTHITYLKHCCYYHGLDIIGMFIVMDTRPKLSPFQDDDGRIMSCLEEEVTIK